MNGKLKIDDKNRRLVMDRKFDAAHRIVGSDEYNLLQMAKADYPTYNVVLRHIKTNPNKRVYKHLTYDYMREYIIRHPYSEERMKEFEEMLLRAKCHMVSYPKVKAWFLEAYPEIDDFTPEQYHEECAAATNDEDYFEVMEAAA